VTNYYKIRYRYLDGPSFQPDTRLRIGQAVVRFVDQARVDLEAFPIGRKGVGQLVELGCRKRFALRRTEIRSWVARRSDFTLGDAPGSAVVTFQ
jgi:hypothetical protein